ncbi:MAG: hypothetical protein JXR97_04220 [Planctomycetes bacterium]|nr:hypothetical protein [Planctomycetota bacterium]
MSKLPEIIKQKIDDYVDARRRAQIAIAAAASVSFYLSFILVAILIDVSFQPGDAIRYALSAVIIVLSLSMCIAFMVIALRKPSRLRAAAMIEKAMGGRMEEQLLSAVELASAPLPGTSDWMAERTILSLAARLEGVSTSNLVDWSLPRKACLLAMTLILMFGGMMLSSHARSYVLRAAVPGGVFGRPSDIDITVMPGSINAAFGADMDIVAKVYPIPSPVNIMIDWDDGLNEELPMSVQGDNYYYRHAMNSLTQGFSYRIIVGGGESERFRVKVYSPPLIERVTLQVTPPDYVNESAFTRESGDAEAVSGSSLKVRSVLSGTPATAASMVTDDGEIVPMSIDGQVAECSMVAMKSFKYRFRLISKDGVIADTSRQWLIEVKQDSPPEVKLSSAFSELRLAGVNDVLEVDVQASDDRNLGDLSLIVIDSAKKAHEIKVPLETEKVDHFAGTVSVPLLNYGLFSGETIYLYAVVADSGGQTAKTRQTSILLTREDIFALEKRASGLRALTNSIKAEFGVFHEETGRWLDLSREFRPDDPIAHKGTALVSIRRMKSSLDRILSVAAQLESSVSTFDGGAQTYCVRLASDIGSWCRLNRDVLDDAERMVSAPAMSEAVIASLRAHLVFDEAERSDLLRRMGRLYSWSEAFMLKLAVKYASERFERVLSAYEGKDGWASPMQYEAGLVQSFYQGVDLSGPVKHSAVGGAALENYEVPGVGKENWSVLMEGEIFVGASAKQPIVCLVDDKIKMYLDGKNLFGESGWGRAGKNRYSSSVNIKKGWHPVKIEFAQQTGDSKLWLGSADAKGKERAIGKNEFRHRDVNSKRVKDICADMREAPVFDLALFRSYCDSDSRMLGNVTKRVNSISQLSDISHLAKLSREIKHHETLLQGNIIDLRRKLSNEAARSALLTWKKLDGMVGRLDKLFESSVEDKGKSGSVVEGEVAPLLYSVSVMRDILTEMDGKIRRQIFRRLDVNREAQIRDILLARSGQLAPWAETCADKFMVKSASSHLSIYERQAAYRCFKLLDEQVLPRLYELESKLGEEKLDKGKVASMLNDVAATLSELSASEDSMIDGSLASAAEDVRKNIKRIDENLAAFSPLNVIAEVKRLETGLELLAKKAYDAGRIGDSEKLHALMSDGLSRHEIKGLSALLDAFTSKLQAERWSVGEPLPAIIKEFEVNVMGATRSLVREYVKLTIISDAACIDGDVEKAIAYRCVLDDFNGLLLGGRIGLIERVKPLFERLAIIEGLRGGDAAQEEIKGAVARVLDPKYKRGAFARQLPFERLALQLKNGECKPNQAADILAAMFETLRKDGRRDGTLSKASIALHGRRAVLAKRIADVESWRTLERDSRGEYLAEANRLVRKLMASRYDIGRMASSKQAAKIKPMLDKAEGFLTEKITALAISIKEAAKSTEDTQTNVFRPDTEAMDMPGRDEELDGFINRRMSGDALSLSAMAGRDSTNENEVEGGAMVKVAKEIEQVADDVASTITASFAEQLVCGDLVDDKFLFKNISTAGRSLAMAIADARVLSKRIASTEDAFNGLCYRLKSLILSSISNFPVKPVGDGEKTNNLDVDKIVSVLDNDELSPGELVAAGKMHLYSLFVICQAIEGIAGDELADDVKSNETEDQLLVQLNHVLALLRSEEAGDDVYASILPVAARLGDGGNGRILKLLQQKEQAGAAGEGVANSKKSDKSTDEGESLAGEPRKENETAVLVPEPVSGSRDDMGWAAEKLNARIRDADNGDAAFSKEQQQAISEYFRRLREEVVTGQ